MWDAVKNWTNNDHVVTTTPLLIANALPYTLSPPLFIPVIWNALPTLSLYNLVNNASSTSTFSPDKDIFL